MSGLPGDQASGITSELPVIRQESLAGIRETTCFRGFCQIHSEMVREVK
jgi:hypothetical protein